MSKIILNEKKRAEEIIENPDLINHKKPSTDVAILARYFYHEEKLNRNQIVKKIDLIMEDGYPFYNDFNWYNTILSYIKLAQKKNLVQIDYVPVTKKELNTISSVNEERKERILFTMLCLSKYYNQVNENNNNWINTNDSEIFKLANVSMKSIYRDKMIHSFINDGYLKQSKNNKNNNLMVTFLDETDETVLKISDYRELGYQYMFYRNNKMIKKCQNCGIFIKIKSKYDGSTKYCKNCAEKITRENWRLSKKKIKVENSK